MGLPMALLLVAPLRHGNGQQPAPEHHGYVLKGLTEVTILNGQTARLSKHNYRRTALLLRAGKAVTLRSNADFCHKRHHQQYCEALRNLIGRANRPTTGSA